VSYGQRHSCELDAAKRVASFFDVVVHNIIELDMRSIGGSALTSDIDVPKRDDDYQDDGNIPVTYVPARNTIFLSIALGWAEALSAHNIFVGVNAVDYSGYPDCRPEFIKSFEQTANLATKDGVEGRSFHIHAPLINLTKADIIRKGDSLGLDYGLTHSCYDPSEDGFACGSCDSCLIRKRAFAESGIADPTKYAG
jgi:7-cyano-7-deazaguanine synthase